MSTRTARWAAHTTPGAAPPPPSRAYTSPAPSIYPESSVSNPYASRYTGYSSRSGERSASVPPVSHHTASSSHRSESRASSHRSESRPRSGTVTPLQTYYAPAAQPIIARTSDANGRNESYMIIPPKGQKVEILHPTPVRSSTMPPPSYARSSSYSGSGASRSKPQPLIRRLFDKVEWNGSRSPSRASSSHSHASSTSSSSSRTRRNSTGSGGWTVVSGASGSVDGSKASASSHGSSSRVVSASGRKYDVVYV